MILNVHFYNGQSLSLNMSNTDDRVFNNIFSNSQVPGAFVIHGDGETVCIPCTQVLFFDYQPEPKLEDTDDDEMPF